MYQVNTFLTKPIQLSYLPCIKHFALPISVSCPVDRNANDVESLPLVSASKVFTPFLWVQNDVHMNQKRRVPVMTENIPVMVRNELTKSVLLSTVNVFCLRPCFI